MVGKYEEWCDWVVKTHICRVWVRTLKDTCDVRARVHIPFEGSGCISAHDLGPEAFSAVLPAATKQARGYFS